MIGYGCFRLRFASPRQVGVARPATMALLGLGGLALISRRRADR
ncbi:MAG: PEP-CTERM sorting domain-containing protein [Planctomycetota bacterium]|nr:PEP-CTERM sorting domain-containing protein [Planctomycetota bacterium]